MREQNSIPNEYPESWDCGTYQTGASKPQKNQSGIITVLLMAVILLGGLASVLGVMNVRLLSRLTQQQDAVLPLSLDSTTGTHEHIAVRGNVPYSVQTPTEENMESLLGFRVQNLSELCRKYWNLSAGLEVISVSDSESPLQEGDILFSADGENLTSASQLYRLIDGAEAGSNLKLQVLRGRQSFTVELTVKNP